jgi:hypothetical protein
MPLGKIIRLKKAKIARGRFVGSKVSDCKGCDLAAPDEPPAEAQSASAATTGRNRPRSGDLPSGSTRPPSPVTQPVGRTSLEKRGNLPDGTPAQQSRLN